MRRSRERLAGRTTGHEVQLPGSESDGCWSQSIRKFDHVSRADRGPIPIHLDRAPSCLIDLDEAGTVEARGLEAKIHAPRARE
ncbi:hypothetical protein PLANTIT3_20043 [Plantibacter sp. T3]|nr:hypothetical protein PLANTIT3_20043 [Plantibacter sp. T3]